MRAEVTVRGAGVMGLALGWVCAARGARVRVIDPRGPGAGASGGLVGALAPHAPERWDEAKAFQRDALLAAGTFWEGVRAAGGVDPGWARTGRLLPLPDRHAVAIAEARAKAAEDLWAGAAVWRLEAAPDGWGPVSASGLVARETLSARVAPRRAIAALAAAIRERGGEIVPDGPEEGAIVEATGWEGLAARGWGGTVRGQAALLRLAGRETAPQIHGPGLYVVPHADGTVAVGSTSEPGETGPATDDRLEALIARAQALVPALAGAPVIERWAGARPRAATGRLVMGQAADGRYVLNGGFRTGFGLAPLAAAVMADLVLDGRDGIPATFRLPETR